MYKITEIKLKEPKVEVELPTYTVNPINLRRDLKRKTGAKEVFIAFEPQERNFAKFQQLKESFLSLEQEGITLKDRVWASNYVRTFDFATVEEKRALLSVVVEAIKWGHNE